MPIFDPVDGNLVRIHAGIQNRERANNLSSTGVLRLLSEVSLALVEAVAQTTRQPLMLVGEFDKPVGFCF